MNRFSARTRWIRPASMRCPFVARDDARNDVERPGAVDGFAFGVDGEGDAHDLDRHLGRGAALAQFRVARGGAGTGTGAAPARAHARAGRSARRAGPPPGNRARKCSCCLRRGDGGPVRGRRMCWIDPRFAAQSAPAWRTRPGHRIKDLVRHDLLPRDQGQGRTGVASDRRTSAGVLCKRLQQRCIPSSSRKGVFLSCCRRATSPPARRW